MNEDEVGAVILAAGQGTRMKSRLAKVLHRVAGRPMLEHVLAAVEPLGLAAVVVVVGHEAQQVRDAVFTDAIFAHQGEQLGTGHAVAQARDRLFGKVSTVLVLCGDAPMIRTATLQQLLDHHHRQQALVTMLTSEVPDPAGYGHIVRDQTGRAVNIVEDKMASELEKQISEINSGIYCFNAAWLWEHLPQLEANSNGEYFLTDLVKLAASERQSAPGVEALMCKDPREILGINDRIQLAEAEMIMRQRVRERLMLEGVTIIDPPSTFVDAAVTIGPDTVLYPNTLIGGVSRIGKDCQIGPGAHLINATVGNGCRIDASVIEDTELAPGVSIGPFCHIRANSFLAEGVRLGNFAEVKNSRLGRGTKMGHFSYIGDANIGDEVNVGAGTITCNYDGRAKHATVVEDGAFLGSDTMLVAPVRIGARAKTGAGAVITRDVPAEAVAYGVPATAHRPSEKSSMAESEEEEREK